MYFGYYSLSVYYESEFINYGGLFIVASSLIAAISVVIAFRLHVKSIKYIWIIVAIVITINSVGDVWYYTLENIGIYEYGNFIDGLWFIADLLMIGILLIHYRLR